MNIKTVLLTSISTMLILLSTQSVALDEGGLSNVPLSIDRAGEISNESVVSPNILFLFDNSGSMNERDCNGKSRNQCLKDASKELINQLVSDGYMKTRLGIAKYPASSRNYNTSIIAPVLDIGTTLYTDEKSRCIKEEKYCKSYNYNKKCTKYENRETRKCIRKDYKGWCKWWRHWPCKKRCVKSKRVNEKACVNYNTTKKCKQEGTRCAEFTYKTEKFSDFLKSKIDSLKPSGGTPMATGLAEIGRYFTENSNNGNNIINIYPETINKSIKVSSLLNASPVVEKPNSHYTEYQETKGTRQPIWKNYDNISAPINAGVKSKAGDNKNRCGKKEVMPDQNHVILLTDGSGNGEKFISRNKTLINYMNKKHREGQYVVDVAKALYEIDLKPGLDGKQNIITHPIAFGRGADTKTLNQVAVVSKSGRVINGEHKAYTASSSKDLLKIFKNILEKMEPEPEIGSSRAALNFDGRILEAGRIGYQVTFNSNPWSGDIKAYNVLTDGTINKDKPLWSARSQLTLNTARNILTYSQSKASGVVISDAGNLESFSSLDQFQQKDLSKILVNAATEAEKQLGRMKFIQNMPLGDIIHSEAIFIPANPENKSTMDALYVGANDGMLHAFDRGGNELFAYMPNGVFSAKDSRGIHYLADKKYDHQYYVDMTPTAQYVDNGSYTALAGGLNGGGKSVYALDVTTPNAMQAGNVLWEYTDASMGYSYSRPRIVKLPNEEWVTLFGNGFPEKMNDSLPSKFYVLKMKERGEVYKEISLEGKGLSTIEAVDMDSDGMADRAYAGDLNGNLWAIDLTTFSQRLLFSSASGQRITTKPTISAHPDGGVMVIFGTGSYHWDGDEKNKEDQSIYGVYDDGGQHNLKRKDLIQVTFDDSGDLRLSNNEAVNWKKEGKLGWYIDLPDKGAGTLSGSERVLSDPVVLGGMVFVSTVVPSNTSECDRGGYGWVMGLKAETGGSKIGNSETCAQFDINQDGNINNQDLVSSESPVGTKFVSGLPTRFKFLVDISKSKSIKTLITDSHGNVHSYEFQSCDTPPVNRYSWRIIRR